MTIDGWIIQINPGFPGNIVAGQPPDEGDRTNLCTVNRNPPFWTNQSIQLANTSFGSPSSSAKVGDNVTVQVALYAGQGTSYTNIIQSIQAWVCYPNTLPGNQFNLNTVVPSMNANFPGSQSPPKWTGNQYITASLQPDVPDDYVGPAGSSATLPGLLPAWTPIAADIMNAPAGLQGQNEVHCCIVVTSSGTSDASGDTQPVGYQVPAPASAPDGVNVCGDGHAGQLNIQIIGIMPGGHMRHRPAGLAFLSGLAGRDVRKAEISVAVAQVAQNEHIDPSVLKFLKAGPYGKLPLKPSKTSPVSFGLMKNGHAMRHGWLSRFFKEIAEELEETVEEIDRMFTGTSMPSPKLPQKSITVAVPSSGIYPLLFHAQFDPHEPVGSVHVFDVIQIDKQTGRRGGMRIAAVIVP